MRRKVTSEHILCKYPQFLVEECGSRPDYQSVICFLTILDSHLFTLDPWLRTHAVGDESFSSLKVQIWSVPSDIWEVSSLKKYDNTDVNSGCSDHPMYGLLMILMFIDLLPGMQPLYWMPAIESLNIGFMSWGPQNHPSSWSLREIRGEKRHTLDGRNPAPPWMVESLKIMSKSPINWRMISSIHSITAKSLVQTCILAKCKLIFPLLFGLHVGMFENKATKYPSWLGIQNIRKVLVP